MSYGDGVGDRRLLFVACTAACAIACGRLEFVALDDAGAVGDGAELAAVGCHVDEIPLAWSTMFDADHPSWANIYGSPTQIQIVGGALEITPDPNTGLSIAYWGYIDTSAADHRGHRMFVEVPQTLSAVPSSQHVLRFGAGNDWAQIFVDNGDLYFEVQVASTPLNVRAPHDPTGDRWWQIRESGGTVFFETSANGIDWTERYQQPTPAFLSTSYIELAAGYYNAQATSIGTARFDNLFVCGS